MTFVVGVVGVSCSGKSTAATELSTSLSTLLRTDVPVLSQDSHFQFDLMESEHCPCTAISAGYTWKNWETKDAVDWLACEKDIRDAIAEGKECIIVEGFQVCSSPNILALVDAVVNVNLPKEECFRRRISRAKSMLHLEEGTGDNMNYEILATYAALPDHKAVLAAANASALCAAEGEYAWLRLYCEEMLWPEAERQRQDLARVAEAGKPMLELDACDPAGKEEWLARRIPATAEWLLQQMPAVAFVQGG